MATKKLGGTKGAAAVSRSLRNPWAGGLGGSLVMARGRKDALDAVWHEESDMRERERGKGSRKAAVGNM